jgi:hypothetical protein
MHALAVKELKAADGAPKTTSTLGIAGDAIRKGGTALAPTVPRGGAFFDRHHP